MKLSQSTSAPSPQPSSPAKAGDPVFRDVSNGIERLRRTGYSAFAEYDGCCAGRHPRQRLTPGILGPGVRREDVWGGCLSVVVPPCYLPSTIQAVDSRLP